MYVISLGLYFARLSFDASDLSTSLQIGELDNDYYLHNFHVNAGRGSLQSMKAYQQMFGVGFSDIEEDGGPTDPKARRHGRSDSNLSAISLTDDRIDRVKQRCNSQNAALSVWWKVAIQSYIQQRMWMQLGASPSASSLPPRFERIHRPGELIHFDKVFSRPWATPSRLSHEDQHKTALDGIDGSGILATRTASPKEARATLFDERVQSYRGASGDPDAAESEDGHVTTLREYVSEHGYAARSQPSLIELIDAHSQKSSTGGIDPAYLGSLQDKKVPSDMYLDYASKETMPRRDFRPGARAEFEECLREVNLDSNDVQGIRKVRSRMPTDCTGYDHTFDISPF